MRLPDDLVEELERSRSATIERIRRARFVYGGQIDDDNGPLELTFSSGQVLLFDSAPDGSTLAVRGTTWKDPFQSPLSPENREWVRTHGKWEVFDVSEEDWFASFVGQSIHSYQIVFWSMAAGFYKVVLELSSALSIRVGIDDLRVSFDDMTHDTAASKLGD